jgi:hypothetical protein
MATTTVLPDGDVTTDWNTTTGATHWDEINEDVDTPTDGSYIETTDVNDTDRFTIGASPANTSEVTSFTVNVRGYLTDVSATARYRINVYATGPGELTGSPQYVTGANLGGYGTTLTTYKGVSFSGNMGGSGTGGALTKAEFDSLEVEITLLET